MQFAKSILDQIGVGGDRLEMYTMSSAMGLRWAEVCREMTERIKALGPNPVRRAARAAVMAVPSQPALAGAPTGVEGVAPSASSGE